MQNKKTKNLVPQQKYQYHTLPVPFDKPMPRNPPIKKGERVLIDVVGKKYNACVATGREWLGGNLSVTLEFLNGANQGITFQVPAEVVTRCEQPRKSARLWKQVFCE